MTSKLAFCNQSINNVKFLVKFYFPNQKIFLLKWIFLHYVFLKLKSCLGTKALVKILPDDIFQRVSLQFCKNSESYVDASSCAFGNPQEEANWFLIVSKITLRKCKICFIKVPEVPHNVVYVSETLSFNIKKCLRVEDLSASLFLGKGKISQECGKTLA